MPEISVIVPAYNVEEHILECLDSIKNQTFSDFECLIVDDKSKDRTLALIESYIKDRENDHDSRFKVIKNQRNLGLYHSRIVGDKNANGKYLCYVDSDDYIHQKFLMHLHDTAAREGADITSCGIEWHGTNKYNKYEGRVLPEDFSRICSMALVNKLYKTPFIHKANEILKTSIGDKTKINNNEDIIKSTSLSFLSGHYYHTKEVLYEHKYRSKGLSEQSQLMHMRDLIQALRYQIKIAQLLESEGVFVKHLIYFNSIEDITVNANQRADKIPTTTSPRQILSSIYGKPKVLTRKWWQYHLCALPLKLFNQDSTKVKIE